ncbi:MAG: RNA polymerase sigma-70 factor [Tannerella sp.]|jgi:RNA polymerase sigma-70 factor (ECF subfamily)|nr:RNA polymerase sigma-70 factor [Tannerella sp.]
MRGEMSGIPITDEKLIIAIKHNDYVSYNNLFVRYYTRLCRYVYRLLPDKEETEDIVQELFMNLWNHRNKIEITVNVSGYLYKMARNLTLNHIRNTKKHQELSEYHEHIAAYTEEDQFESDEFRIALYDCIDRLPPRSREVLLLHRIEGLKQKEIAEKLSIAIKTIKNQIWSSLQSLKACLERKGI